jgi:hypothetical protein
VRAGGSLTIAGGISDGVIPRAASVLSLASDDSWSIGLVAGADLGSSNAFDVGGHGNLLLAPGAVVRTGTGDVRIAAGGDLRFGDAASAIYTAGRSTGFGTLPSALAVLTLARAEYPDAGGDVRIDVSGNIIGAPSHQLFTQWWWRFGGESGNLGNLPTNYGVVLGAFQQGVASFGGGDVSIAAGGDVRDLSVVLPVTAQHVGDVHKVGTGTAYTFSDNSFIKRGGGDLDVAAGGDVVGGTFWVADGTGVLKAGGAFRSSDATGLGLMLGLTNASVKVTAVDDLRVEGVMNPSLLPQSEGQRSVEAVRDYFASYGPNDSFEATSLAGNVQLANDRSRIAGWVGVNGERPDGLNFGATGQDDRALDLYPGTVTARALTGNVELLGDFSLFPAADGGLTLLARNDVAATRVSVDISDADVALLPGERAPARSLDELRQRIPRANITGTEFFHARTPVHSSDTVPSNIVAELGDVTASESLQIISAEPLRVTAGRDVRELDLRIQNVGANDVSLVQAGRDIKYTTQRSPTSGLVLNNSNRIEISGPGRLDVMAGRNVDLGTSEGIISTGDQGNSALADSGANVLVFAGVKGIDDSKFVEDFVLPSATNTKIVADAIRARENDATLSDGQALAVFQGLTEFERREIVQGVLFAELRSVGESSATSDTGFERGFDAIAALFPKNDTAGGDLTLFFSRIQTADGGNVDLDVPYGLVNAGLSATFAGAKAPDQLGIVAQRTGNVNAVVQGDIQVNQSRVFALDGGSILLWSSEGNIDAGRGAKTALAAPAPVVTFDQNGNVVVEFPPAIAGSGIRTAVSTPGLKPGDVFLFAPAGVVNAGDAGIVSAGNLTIAATDVIGADNIDVGGVSVGVPVDTSGLAAGLGNVGDVSATASRSAEEAVAAGAESESATQSLAGSAMGWLDVFLEGYGPAENGGACDPKKDPNCKG